MENFIDTRVSLFFVVFSVIGYIYDVVMDVVLAAVHYSNGNLTYFYLTLSFVFVPSITMTCFNLRFYLSDEKEFEEKELPKASRLDWIVRTVFLTLQTGPILRYLDAVRYGVKSLQRGPKQAFYHKKMMCEQNDASFLRLLECFMEAGPQLLLQLYIFAQKDEFISTALTKTEIIQLSSMFGSLLSMSWALAAYQRSLRNALTLCSGQGEKFPLSRSGYLVMMIWRFFDIGARVLALGLLASLFPVWIAVLCVVHFGIMLVWIISMKTSFCDTRYEEIIYNIALAVVFLFCYFNPKDTPTRWRYVTYYVFTFLENTALMTVWYIYSSSSSYKLLAMLIQFLSFPLAIIFMVIYYLLLHPTQNIQIFTQNEDSRLHEQNGAYVLKACVPSSVGGLETAV